MKPSSTCIRYTLLIIIILVQSCGLGDEVISANLVISNVTVIDVTDGKLLKNQDVFVSADSVHTIAPTNRVLLPDSITIVDGKDKFLIPGLWDMHVHASREFQRPTQFRLMLANGITGFRDMWGTIHEARQAIIEVNEGQLPGPPRFEVSGNLIDGARPLFRGSLSAPTPERGVELVDSLHLAGAPFIKVYFGLSLETYNAIANRCKELNMPFAGHVPMSIPIIHTSETGQKSIEHMTSVVLGCSKEEAEILKRSQAVANSGNMSAMVQFYTTEMPKRMLASEDETTKQRLFETLAQNQTWQVPTLVSLKGKAYMNRYKEKGDDRIRYYSPPQRWLADGPFGFAMKDSEWELAQAQYEKEEALVGEMFKAGVPILAGTDAGTPWTFPGFSIHEELSLFVKAGLTPLEALQTATLHPALFFNQTDQLGTIKEGNLADLVLLNANPLENIANTTKIEAVVADGQLYSRADLDHLLSAVEQMVKADRKN